MLAITLYCITFFSIVCAIVHTRRAPALEYKAYANNDAYFRQCEMMLLAQEHKDMRVMQSRERQMQARMVAHARDNKQYSRDVQEFAHRIAQAKQSYNV